MGEQSSYSDRVGTDTVNMRHGSYSEALLDSSFKLEIL